MSYFSVALQPKKIRSIAEVAQKVLLAAGITQPKFVIGRGMSGALALPVFAEALEADIVIARKPSDDSHGGSNLLERIHRLNDVCDWVFVDDFVESGATLRSVIKLVASKPWQDRLPIAAVFYCPSSHSNTYLSDSTFPSFGFNLDNHEAFVNNVPADRHEAITQILESYEFKFIKFYANEIPNQASPVVPNV